MVAAADDSAVFGRRGEVLAMAGEDDASRAATPARRRRKGTSSLAVARSQRERRPTLRLDALCFCVWILHGLGVGVEGRAARLALEEAGKKE